MEFKDVVRISSVLKLAGAARLISLSRRDFFEAKLCEVTLIYWMKGAGQC